MRVKILDQEIQLTNHSAAISELFSMIEEKLKDTGYIFSALTVDGVEIDTDYALYLSQRIEEIQEIVVGVKSFRTLMEETMRSATEYLDRVQPEVEKLGDEFYQGPNEETWGKFSQLLEGLQWLLEAGTVFDSYQPKQQTVYPWGAEFQDKIKLIEEAMENNDYVLLGDLLKYEISPLFSSLDETIKELFRTEGYHLSSIN